MEQTPETSHSLMFKGKPMVVRPSQNGQSGLVEYPAFKVNVDVAVGKLLHSKVYHREGEICFNDSSFSIRDLQILELLSEGKHYEEIAQTLGISIYTAKNTIAKTITRNSTPERPMLVDDLVLMAEYLELLNPLSIDGLASLLPNNKIIPNQK